MATTIEVEVEECGVKKNQGQGYTAWIKSTEGGYYTKYCMTEEEGNKILQSLSQGDKIFLKYYVKNGFTNFLSYQTNNIPSDTQKKPVEQKKEQLTKTEEQREKAIMAELEKEEQAKEKLYDQYYVIKINKAERIVDHAGIPKEDPAYPSILAAVFTKITTPRVYLKEKEVAKYIPSFSQKSKGK
ncbi:MAG TPA: hypothetical protein ENH28_02285 [Euryarchaeota archaeon]|nr:hypothetical protein [Euryarchaeota archaeon]